MLCRLCADFWLCLGLVYTHPILLSKQRTEKALIVRHWYTLHFRTFSSTCFSVFELRADLHQQLTQDVVADERVGVRDGHVFLFDTSVAVAPVVDLDQEAPTGSQQGGTQ